MSKVIVTGADGFIGSHLVEHLTKKGLFVKAFAFIIHFHLMVGCIILNLIWIKILKLFLVMLEIGHSSMRTYQM